MSFVQSFFISSNADQLVDAGNFAGTVQHDCEVINASGGIVTCDFRVDKPSIKEINISAPITLNLPTLTAGKSGSGILYFKQDSVGDHSVSLNPNVRLNSGNWTLLPSGITVGYVTWIGDGFVDLTLSPRTI